MFSWRGIYFQLHEARLNRGEFLCIECCSAESLLRAGAVILGVDLEDLS